MDHSDTEGQIMGHLRFHMNMTGRDRLWVYPVPIIMTVTLNRRHWNYFGFGELASVADQHNRRRSALPDLNDKNVIA